MKGFYRDLIARDHYLSALLIPRVYTTIPQQAWLALKPPDAEIRRNAMDGLTELFDVHISVWEHKNRGGTQRNDGSIRDLWYEFQEILGGKLRPEESLGITRHVVSRSKRLIPYLSRFYSAADHAHYIQKLSETLVHSSTVEHEGETEYDYNRGYMRRGSGYTETVSTYEYTFRMQPESRWETRENGTRLLREVFEFAGAGIVPALLNALAWEPEQGRWDYLHTFDEGILSYKPAYDPAKGRGRIIRVLKEFLPRIEDPETKTAILQAITEARKKACDLDLQPATDPYDYKYSHQSTL